MKKVKFVITINSEMTDLQIKSLEKPFNLDAYVKNVLVRTGTVISNAIFTAETEEDRQDRIYDNDVEEMRKSW